MNTRKSKKGAFCSKLVLCLAFAPGVPAPEGAEERCSQDIAKECISAHIENKPLSEVVKALEKKAGIAIQLEAPKLKNHTITARFTGLDLRAALKEVLREMNYAIVGEADKTIRVLVYSLLREDHKGATRTVRIDGSRLTEEIGFISLDPPISANALEASPEVQISQIRPEAATQGLESLWFTLNAIHDTDPAVRQVSEELLLDNLRDMVPKEILATMAGRSERAEIRIRALETLAERQDDPEYALLALEVALNDGDVFVRNRAQELIVELTASTKTVTDNAPQQIE